jgi:hypothetical protein
MNCNYPNRGAQSPWGAIEHVVRVAPGIASVSTESHGGLWLNAERQQELPAALAAFTPWTGSREWWEEDADWAVPVLAWPHHFPPETVRLAVLCARPRPGWRYFESIAGWWTSPAGMALMRAHQS